LLFVNHFTVSVSGTVVNAVNRRKEE